MDDVTGSARMPAGAAGVRGRTPRRRSAVAVARSWVAASLRDLTWRRFGVFCFVVGILALSQPRSFGALFSNRGENVLWGLARPYIYMFLTFAPVLFAVLAVEAHRPRSVRARIVALAIAVVAAQLAGVVLSAFAIKLLYPGGSWIGSNQGLNDLASWVRYFSGRWPFYLVISAIGAAFYHCMRRDMEASEAMHAERLGREEVERENTEATLLLLQAQIEPHFLFNSLASVRRLYRVAPEAGESMLHQLTSYLTASLPVFRATTSTLEREVALATAYLNVQKIRMESRLAFEVDVPESLQQAVVPPLMVSTLVENAVIHGLGPVPAGGHIRIGAREVEGRLRIEVTDTGQGLQQTSWGTGVGLANIRTRLRSAFGADAALTLAERPEGGVRASLDMPLALTAAQAKAA